MFKVGNTMTQSIQNKLRKIFNHDNIEVHGREIHCYYLRNRGREWVPFGGGPLYGSVAVDHTAWLARHIETYRDLLPKVIRNYRVVFGEFSDGKFRPLPLPEKQNEDSD